eukprot:2722882-Alexandrium_andersonii.AAC.1
MQAAAAPRPDTGAGVLAFLGETPTTSDVEMPPQESAPPKEAAGAVPGVAPSQGGGAAGHAP